MSVLQSPLTTDLVLETRQRLGLTQEQFALLVGVSYQSVNRWSNGRTKPLPLVLKQIKQRKLTMGEPGIELLAKYFPDALTDSESLGNSST